MAQKSNHMNLSLMAHYGRSAIKYGLIALVVFIVGRFALNTAAQLYRTLNPPGPPAPTMGFGLLPSPTFPAQLPEERPQQLVLETVGQRLPTFGTQARVYFVPGYQPDLLALDQAKQKAAELGFLFEPEKISNQVYRWRQRAPLPASLEIDIVNNLFELKVDWASSVTLLDKKFIPDDKQATSEVRTLLRNIQLNAPDLATASPRIKYLKALAGETRQAESFSTADFTQADLFRNVPGGYPSVTSEAGRGVIRVLFSGSRNAGERVLFFSSQYYPVVWENVQTYPLQTTNQAWQQLQAGEGYVTNKGTGNPAVIRNAYLAYYEPPLPNSYYQPVYVFEGDNGFQALVPALDPQVYKSN
jgi:hypothetical protein